MNIEKGVKGRVFDPKKSGSRERIVIGKLTTFEGKSKDDINRYSTWNTNFVGDAYEKALDLCGCEKITINKGKVESNWNKEHGRLFVRVTVYDFDVCD